MTLRIAEKLRRWVGKGGSASAQTDLEKLLRRPAINLDTPELQRFLAGKTILVTGAGGSIGSEICRQIMRFCPGRLILLEQAENGLFEIEAELKERWMGAVLVPCVGGIWEGGRVGQGVEGGRAQGGCRWAGHKHG